MFPPEGKVRPTPRSDSNAPSLVRSTTARLRDRAATIRVMRNMVSRRVQPRRRFRWPVAVGACLVCFGALAVGCGSSPDGGASAPTPIDALPGSPPAEATVRVVFLGDSLSAGYGLPEADAFPARVERALRAEGFDVAVVNAGVSGDTSAGGLSRIDWVLRSDPDVVVVELGANDALRGQPPMNTERNLRGIVERARSSGAAVLLLGMDVPTSLGLDYGRKFSAVYPRIAEDLDVPLVPGFVREVGLDPGLMQPDGLHPTAEGHRVLAESLVPHVRALVADAD